MANNVCLHTDPKQERATARSQSVYTTTNITLPTSVNQIKTTGSWAILSYFCVFFHSFLSTNFLISRLQNMDVITILLSSVEIKFNDKVKVLISLSSITESWNAKVIIVSSLSSQKKLKHQEIRDLIFSKDICRRELFRPYLIYQR